MNQPINKDLLIAVLTKENSELTKLVKLQIEQIVSYEEHLESYRALVENYRETESKRIKLEDTVNDVIKIYEDKTQQLHHTLKVQNDYITELEGKLETPEDFAAGIDATE